MDKLDFELENAPVFLYEVQTISSEDGLCVIDSIVEEELFKLAQLE